MDSIIADTAEVFGLGGATEYSFFENQFMGLAGGVGTLIYLFFKTRERIRKSQQAKYEMELAKEQLKKWKELTKKEDGVS